MSAPRFGRFQEADNGDHWPGFVDALATLLLVIVFLLAVFVVSQVSLSQALTGRDEQLAALNAQLAVLADELALARDENADLNLRITGLETEIAGLEDERCGPFVGPAAAAASVNTLPTGRLLADILAILDKTSRDDGPPCVAASRRV